MGTPRRTAQVFRGTAHNLRRLAAALHRGELVAVPSETVYGLAANALAPQACQAIFTAKGRPANDPLIVHLHSWAQVEQIAVPNEAARTLATRFWPGPLTLVLPKRPIIDPIVTSGLTSVAVRMPQHPLFRRLLRQVHLPLAAPSANPFGYISPTTAEHVRAGLGKKIRYILDGGPCPIGLESTIVDLRDPERPCILRPGAISRAQIAAVLRRPIAELKRNSAPPASPQQGLPAPGLLHRHYSPRLPVVLHESIQDGIWSESPRHQAWLLQAKPRRGAKTAKNVFWLDPHGDLRGAARRLFAQLRHIDSAGFTCLHVELARGGDLAEAINDRLRRAAAQG